MISVGFGTGTIQVDSQETGMSYKFHIRPLSGVLLLAALLVAPLVAAQESANAYDVVENATARVMAVVAEAGGYIDQGPERYYSELQVILDEVVDFPGFARGVMGPFASKSYYRSLNAEGRARLKDQVGRFTKEMQRGLVRTYGKGLLAFGGSRVEVQRPPVADEASSKASIVQLIYSGNDEPYVIHYQMRRNRDGAWKLRNLIVESINLGQVYRNQFQAAVRDAKGDLDAVIDGWSTADASG